MPDENPSNYQCSNCRARLLIKRRNEPKKPCEEPLCPFCSVNLPPRVGRNALQYTLVEPPHSPNRARDSSDLTCPFARCCRKRKSCIVRAIATGGSASHSRFRMQQDVRTSFDASAASAHLLHSHLADSAQGAGPATFTHIPALAFCAPIHHALQSKVSGCPRSSL